MGDFWLSGRLRIWEVDRPVSEKQRIAMEVRNRFETAAVAGMSHLGVKHKLESETRKLKKYHTIFT